MTIWKSEGPLPSISELRDVIDPLINGEFDIYCDEIMTSIMKEFGLNSDVVNTQYGKSVIAICAGMGLNTISLSDLAATYDPKLLDPELKTTVRRYWPLPSSKPLPKPDNRPYYRRYERKQHR